MLQMGMVMEHITGKPSVKICRIAGQYGKPRSKPTEVVAGHGEIMSFKGDNINGYEPTDRKWDPDRLLQGYWHSAATLNFLRGYASSGDHKAIQSVDISELKSSPEFASISEDAKAMSSKGLTSDQLEFFTSHEAMQLDLEEALTSSANSKYYNLSAHMVWIGDRTRQLDCGHVEYFKGIANPIGVKVGPSMKNDELKELVQVLNPNKEEGRLVLITRYGAGKAEAMLPGHIQAVKESGVPVVWQCDGVHGNGVVAKSNKLKTRMYKDIMTEIAEVVAIHKKAGSVLGGVHLEVTGQCSVTECVGGSAGVTEEDLTKNYETYCDPRLNYAQSIEAAFQVGSEMPSAERAAKRQKK
jgi:3-deoxy-7-phosphoheptulonate synthase